MMAGKERFSGWILCVILVQNVLSCVRSLPVEAASGGGGTADGGKVDLGYIPHLAGGLFVTIATLVSLSTVLVLCVCGNKPQKDGQTEDAEANGGIEAVNNEVHIVPLKSPTPDELTVPASDGPQAAPQNGKPKVRTGSVQSQKSLTNGPPEDAIVRSSTIDRRLPELPPTPMAPVTPTNEDEEDDYNRTYDVIGDTKGANRMSKVERQPSKEEDIAEVEDEQYACVTNSGANQTGQRSEAKEAKDQVLVDQQDVGEEELDEAYASVVVGSITETESASYASVGTKDDRNGYARLRSLQFHPARDSSPDGGEKSGYARLRDVTLEGGAVGGDSGAVGNDDEEAPPVPYKPPDLQNEDEADEVSAIERTSSTGQAEAGAPTSLMPEGTNTGPNKKREPPYTQVSARESLDVVRARQQAEQNARITTHYQSIEEDQTLDADHDGIYEPVDDQHVDKQPLMHPPPLPGDRQGPSASKEPSASNDWQMTKAPRLYEEITDETRPKPTQAAPDQPTEDDIQPYAVTEKRPVPNDAPTYAVSGNMSEANYAKVNKAHKEPSSRSNNNAKTEVKAPPMSDDELPVYAVVEKKSKGQGSKDTKRNSARAVTPTPPPVVQEDSYQSIEDVPRNSDSNTAAIAGGMVHVDEQPTSSSLWQKKEHMYIDVESNKPSKPSENAHSAVGGSHSYEIVSVVPPSTSSKKEKQKAAKKAKKDSKKEKKHSKGGHHEKGSDGKGEKPKEAEGNTVWKQQDAVAEGNGNANNNTDEYEDIVFPLQETRL